MFFFSLTTRERRTEPGDRVRAPQSVERIWIFFFFSFSICLFFYIYIHINIYIYSIIYNKYLYKFVHRNRSCQESNHGRAVARARRGTLSQHSGFIPQPVSFPIRSIRFFYQFFPSKFRSSSRYMFTCYTEIIDETGWFQERLHRHLLRGQSIFQRRIYICIYTYTHIYI